MFIVPDDHIPQLPRRPLYTESLHWSNGFVGLHLHGRGVGSFYLYLDRRPTKTLADDRRFSKTSLFWNTPAVSYIPSVSAGLEIFWENSFITKYIG